MEQELKAQLKDQLYEKMSRENKVYLEKLKTKPVDEIISSAYQIACRENLLFLFEGENDLSVRQLQVLMEMSAPLRELYEDWCSKDNNEMELLCDSIKSSVNNILDYRAKKQYRNPQAPLYEKTFSEAKEADELYEWKADHLQSCQCNHMFAQNAEKAHHSGELSSFLQKWTAEYGLERCMFILSCSIVQRTGDGRFYPPARQATARFSHCRNRHEESEIANYCNSVHSGIINLAMEDLLKMELNRDRSKSKIHENKQPVR